MIYDFYNAEFSKALCMRFKLKKIETCCIKKFSKQYCFKIIINKNKYFKYY